MRLILFFINSRSACEKWLVFWKGCEEWLVIWKECENWLLICKGRENWLLVWKVCEKLLVSWKGCKNWLVICKGYDKWWLVLRGCEKWLVIWKGCENWLWFTRDVRTGCWFERGSDQEKSLGITVLNNVSSFSPWTCTLPILFNSILIVLSFRYIFVCLFLSFLRSKLFRAAQGRGLLNDVNVRRDCKICQQYSTHRRTVDL